MAFDLANARVSAGEAAVYATGNDDLQMARLIAELIDDSERRARMGAIGREHVETSLAWSYQAERLVGMYQELATDGAVVIPRPEGYPSVSVTVVNHSAREDLRRCLESLRRHPYTLGEMEVVVVDNASEDGSVDMLLAEYPEVVVLAERTRRGFGANQNLAVAAAGGDAVFLLNPDATVHEATIDRLASGLVTSRSLGSAGGPVVNADGSPRQGRPNRFPTPWGIYAKASGLRRLRGPRRRRGNPAGTWASGGACLVDRAAFDAVGDFDEGLFMYSEDTDLFARMAGTGSPAVWGSTTPRSSTRIRLETGGQMR